LTADHCGQRSGWQSGHGAEHCHRSAESAEGDWGGIEDQDVDQGFERRIADEDQ